RRRRQRRRPRLAGVQGDAQCSEVNLRSVRLGDSTLSTADDQVESLISLKNTAFSGDFQPRFHMRATHPMVAWGHHLSGGRQGFMKKTPRTKRGSKEPRGFFSRP